MPTGSSAEFEQLRERETFLHYIAREGRVFLRWTIVVCVVAIVAIMVSPFWMAAVIPALLLLAAYVLLVLANAVERRSDPVVHAALERANTAGASDVIEDHAEDHQFEPRDVHIIKREGKTGLLIVAAVMLIALVIAGILLPWELVAIGALVVFAYMLLLAAPLLLGWIEDDIDLQTEQTPHVRTGDNGSQPLPE